MASPRFEKEYDGFFRRMKWLAAVVFGLIVALWIFYAFYFEYRLDSLRYRSPDELHEADISRGDLYHLSANPVEGQVVYVPVYSHIYHGDGEAYFLTITLSVRNTSLNHEIIVDSIRYFDTKGSELKSYLKKPVKLPALGTTEIVIERGDKSGGSGANFLVEWHANEPVTEPIIEAVMIDTNAQQGISFVRRGSVISNVVPQKPTSGSSDQESATATDEHSED